MRILRARIVRGSEPVVLQAVRHAAAETRTLPGVKDIWVGRSIDTEGPMLVTVGHWARVEDLIAAYGDDWAKPKLTESVDHLLTSIQLEHFEIGDDG